MIYKFASRNKRKAARVLLALWISNILLPSAAHALTSGPSQPEMQGFKPVGTTDMVDLFSGDFKYDIPLLDVDGYPVNLNYASGSGMDDEATWVGLGWNLNVGSINRQLRGIADDFSGDQILTEHYTLPKVTVGGRATVKVEVGGKLPLKGSGSFTLGIFNDNYTGMGAEVGANAGISYSLGNSSWLTGGLGIGVMSSTASGVDLTPYASLTLSEKVKGNVTVNQGLSGSLGYNTRSGIKSLTLGTSFGASQKRDKLLIDTKGNDNPLDDVVTIKQETVGSGSSSFGGSTVSYNTEPVMPAIQIPYKSTYGSFSADIGGAGFLVFAGGGVTGYKSVREVLQRVRVNQEFGFLYAERGKNNPNAVMDFTREKDNPVIPELPNLAVPVHTPDLFSYTSQAGSGQFRLYRGGTGEFFDNEVSDQSDVSTLGFDFGLGAYFHGGVTYFDQTTTNSTRKWRNDNAYLNRGDFQDAPGADPRKEHVYFKRVGEKIDGNPMIDSKLYGVNPLAVNIDGITANSSFRNNGDFTSSNLAVDSTIEKKARTPRRTAISYLTAKEAAMMSSGKNIKWFNLNNYGSFTPAVKNRPTASDSVKRVSDYRQPHHISELTITESDGKRMLYGIPAYNNFQEEYTFAIPENPALIGNNQVNIESQVNTGTFKHRFGIDHYFHKERQPGYAYAYLLSGVVSADYIDKTNNGITDDDAGTAIKFNYSKLNTPFKWRTPYDAKVGGSYKKTATLNKGMPADPYDNKGNIVYGEKELWYVHSVESKTKIAYFITQDRLDALGVSSWKGGIDTLHKQRCLKEIRLYSKDDTSRPIKVVKFEYGYDLCKGTPNSIAPGQGKLTLKKVWFEYGNTHKGSKHPYEFTYNILAGSGEVPYTTMATDRWGTYKNPASNYAVAGIDLKNDGYPYSIQDSSVANQNAALWHLSKIDLPTGGTINVKYESDDYAYVQDKLATAMVPLKGFNTGPTTGTVSMKNTTGIKVQLDSLPTGISDQTSWFKNTYLNGSEYIYTKLFVKMSTEYMKVPNNDNAYDFVSSYNKIQHVAVDGAGIATITFEPITEGGATASPQQFSAWQRLKNDYPAFAYRGYSNRIKAGESNLSAMQAVTAVVSAVWGMGELFERFYHKAERLEFASDVQLNKSFVKLCKINGHKLGGGVRVKQIAISDNWNTMTGSTAPNANYGQQYEYTTTAGNGRQISSGVASYEPSLGGDENALREPVNYTQRIKGAIDNFFQLEAPFGESYFPSAGVGYSKVTVTDLAKNSQPDPQKRTGYVVNEFYTARDYPVKVTVLPIERFEQRPSSTFSLVRTNSIHQLCLSQGYSIELNDMHGKEKATRVFNQSGAEIAYTFYEYKNKPSDANDFSVSNNVKIISPDGKIKNSVIGRDIEFFTDFREQETNNFGTAINIGADVIPVWGFPLPIPHWPVKENNDYKLFRSACAVKVIQYFGFVKRVIKMQNGSTVETESVAFDGLTGDPVISRTQNEFKQDIFSVNIPAYWPYTAMGGAYQNLGFELRDVSADGSGNINTSFDKYLQAGDELTDPVTGNRYWVSHPETHNMLLDSLGKVQLTIPSKLKVIRSGYRNMMNAGTSTVVCLNNPIIGDNLALRFDQDNTNLKVINTSATLYDEKWAQEADVAKYDTVATTTTTKHYIWAILKSYWEEESYPAGDTIYYPAYNYIDIYKGPSKTTPPPFSPTNAYEWTGSVTITNKVLNLSYGLIAATTYSRAVSGTSEQFYLSNRTYSGYSLSGWNRYAGGSIVDGRIITESFQIAPFTFADHKLVDSINVDSTTYEYIKRPVNPYLTGHLGNWRPSETKVFQQVRNSQKINTKTGMGLKDAGFIKAYRHWWKYDSVGKKWGPTSAPQQWVTANTVTLYDKFGQELENKDALNRYSAANFNFRGQLPAAVASNARNRQIFYMGFEDRKSVVAADTMRMRTFRHVGTNKRIDTIGYLYPDSSHTGNYSTKLPASGVKMYTALHHNSHKTDYWDLNTSKEYVLKSTPVHPRGFEPDTGKYIFQVWVKDLDYTHKSVNVSLSTNVGSVPLTCKAIVEKWKLLEGTIDLSSASVGNLTITLTPASGKTVYIDDLRIHPVDSHMKTYAYDDKTLRLMAELDENGFATFYEYDDEGTLIRVKKETERGIMTLKESRSSYQRKD